MSNWGQRPGWFNIKMQAEDGTKPLLVHIFDEIGFWGVSAQDFVSQLLEHDGDLEMHINSPGGDIFDGIAIYNTVKQRSGDTTVIIDGLAASAASFIAQAASPGKLFVAPHGQVMIHDGFAMAIGNAKDMRETADLLDKASDNIAGIYAGRTGRDVAYWRALMREETWYSDQESVDSGLVDAILGQAGGAAGSSFDLEVFDRVHLLGTANNHAPFKGTHTHVHGAFGAGPSNAATDTHSHEHEHDDDANHNPANGHAGGPHSNDHDADDEPPAHDLFSGLLLNASVDESSWDADRAWREAGEASAPAKAFAEICAGRRDGPADERKNWALPHHYPGKACNANGVRNALARFSSTQGLTNTSSAEAHLHAHMKVINPEWKPGDAIPIEWYMQSLQEVLT
jgi:ATP-dependent Clp endopeptidase proteolytic subunit ClpP